MSDVGRTWPALHSDGGGEVARTRPACALPGHRDMARPWPAFRPAGDSGLYVQLGEDADAATHARVLALWRELVRRPLPGMEEAVPGYRSVLVTWNPDVTTAEAVRAELLARLARLPRRPRLPAGRLLTIPVVYGGSFGPDLDEVARRLGLSPDEVVRLHAGATYRVWLVGFMPGFAYLGPLERRLWTPRRPTPRVRIPAGSVGIGGSQTGIYAVESPGGWQIIGRTWLSLWDPARPAPALLRPGDRVRFQPVALDQAPPEWAQAAEAAWPPAAEVVRVGADETLRKAGAEALPEVAGKAMRDASGEAFQEAAGV